MAKDSYWFIDGLSSDKKQFDVVYILKFDRFYKVGITNNLKQRFTAFYTTLPLYPELIGYFNLPYGTGLKMETALLNELISYKTRGEWVECNEEVLMDSIHYWSKILNCKFITQ